MTIKKGLYQHFKGNYYEVLDIARHSETEEQLVIYRALYGEKGIWARPLSLFAGQTERNGETTNRFTFCGDQSLVLEVAVLEIKQGQTAEFEMAFSEAQSILSSMKGYISHQLRPCVESTQRYLLLVNWETLEDHIIGFRESEEYQRWRELLHHFYQPFPDVEHYGNPL